MRAAAPYAVAAKLAHPDPPVLNGINALIDAAHYHPRWSDPRLVVLVLNNGDLNQVTWEQRVLQGDPKFEAAQTLPDFPYARYAELIGLRGIRVDTPDEIAGAWDAALSADRPVVLEAITDPEVPPLPPHITLEQAKAVTKALLKRDPGSLAIVRQSLRDKIAELRP